MRTSHGIETKKAWLSSLPAIVVLSAALTALFWPTVLTLLDAWRDTDNLTYTHGYLIAAMCGWLLIRASRSIDGVGTPDWRMVVALGLLSLGWLLFYRAGIEVAHQILLPAMAIVAACAAFGVVNGRKLGFAFAYLYFAVPVWSMGNEILQAITVLAVRILLQISAIPAYVTGNLVHIPSGVFEIAGGCSGLHFFIVALAIAAIYGEIHRDSLRVRLQQVALAALLAMASNWVRVYVIILAGHLTDMRHFLITVDHYYFGWFLFVITMSLFFWLAGRMPARAPEVAEPADAGAVRRLSWVSGVLIAITAAGVGPALDALAPIREAVASQSVLPAGAGRWQGPHATQEVWRPVYPQADRTEIGEYRVDSRGVTVFVAQYLQQRQGKELIGFDNSIAGNGAWMDNLRTVETARGDAAMFDVGGTGGRSIVLYYYRIGESRMTSGFAAQLAYAAASLRGPVLSQLVAAHARCASDCAAEAADATDLLDEIDATIAASSNE